MAEAKVHPTAQVASDVRLASDVEVGAYAVLEGPGEIGAGTVIAPHAVIHPFVRLGERNRIDAHAVVGGLPQDVGFDGQETWAEIGDDNTLREGVTINRATDPDTPTRIGSGCFFMTCSHVGHDCNVGDGVIMTNNTALGGHVEAGDGVNIGGGALVHQYVRLGTGAMVGGLSGVNRDVLPYTMAYGLRAAHYRLNTVGLRRAGIKGERYRVVERAFRALRDGDSIDDLPDTPEMILLRAWLAAPSKRGLCGFLGRD